MILEILVTHSYLLWTIPIRCGGIRPKKLWRASTIGVTCNQIGRNSRCDAAAYRNRGLSLLTAQCRVDTGGNETSASLTRLACGNQPLAHQHRIGAVGGVVAQFLRTLNPGLCHLHNVIRQHRCKTLVHGEVHVEGLQIAGVDAENLGTSGLGTLSVYSCHNLNQLFHLV